MGNELAVQEMTAENTGTEARNLLKRSKGASDVVVASAVQKRIDALKAAYPDVELKQIDTSVDYTKGNYEAAISTLFEGAILAVIVVFLFLRDIRATVISAIALPLSIIPAFWAMDLMGFSLNLVSLLAITIVIAVLEWPRRAATTLGCTPFRSARVAWVWRRSCNRTVGTSARSHSALNNDR